MNNPFPQDVSSECRKCCKIIEQFIVKNKGIDQIIPPQIIAQARGVAILSVFKAGFLFSGRGGSGLVLARMDDGSWSPPSAIGTAGFGAGGQIGVEVTDFVIILNTKDAVKAFSHGGNVTLGGNLSVAAGPVGRSIEGSGTAMNLAAIYSYSVTRGLFVGVSLEGSVIIERKETNAKFYGRKVSAKEILSGNVAAPPDADDLYSALNRRTREELGPLPVADVGIKTRPQSTLKQGIVQPLGASNLSATTNYTPRPKPPPPPSRSKAGINQVTAMYDFAGERPGDLSFSTGDIITVIKKNENSWWLGRIQNREGLFPCNYVE